MGRHYDGAAQQAAEETEEGRDDSPIPTRTVDGRSGSRKNATASLLAALIIYTAAVTVALVVLISGGGLELCTPAGRGDVIGHTAALALAKVEDCLSKDGANWTLTDECENICRALPGYCDETRPTSTQATTTQVTQAEPATDGMNEERNLTELNGRLHQVQLLKTEDPMDSQLDVYLVRDTKMKNSKNESVVRMCACWERHTRCKCIGPCPFTSVEVAYGATIQLKAYESTFYHK